jgi:nucleotide-binding universal stress UspA family protein
MTPNGPILLCYDGSADATAAIQEAAVVLRGRRAVVACFWQPVPQGPRRFAVNLLEVVQQTHQVNEREAQLAHERAHRGAAFANEAGLQAEARAIEISTPLVGAIIAYADEIDAPLIVVGSRGRSVFGSMLLGDVAQELVQRATRMVAVVPSARLASRRGQPPAGESPKP